MFDAGETTSSVTFEGKDGKFYKAGYAPLFHDGAVVGAIGVEGSAEFFGPLARLYRAYAALVFCALMLLGLTAVLMGRGLAGPLTRLMESALRIGRGDLKTPVAAGGTMEVGVLARELEVMRHALASRDQQLKMMLAGVAHEVRNPIGGMELFAGLLAEELAASAPSDARSHLARIQRELEYLKRIVEDFLAFAREQPLNLLPLEVGALLDSVEELMKAEAEAKQVALRVQAEPGTVQGDESLLVAAIVNLVKNAVQASSAGEAVAITGRRSAGRYLLEVADRGGGIPLEVQERIFEPFFTTRQQGTGLGLPLARKILRAHQGEIEVSSAPGATVFRVELPSA